MKAWPLAVVGVTAALTLTACGAMLKGEESTWCRDHPEQVVAASYTIGGPLTLGRVLEQVEAENQSPEYVLACRSAFQNRSR